MHEIGLLGLDSVHADTFARVLWKYHDARVTAVWDGGAVRDEEHFSEFCSRYGADGYETPEAMIDDVDAAIVSTLNWDTHVDLAIPFLEAGIPTLVDKPIAGNVPDIETMSESSEAGGAVFFGGSAIPYQYEMQNLSDGVPNRTIHCSSYRGSIRYGPHAIDPIRKLVGANWTSVETIPAPGKSVAVQFENGSYATVRFDGPMADAGFGYLDIGDRMDVITIRSFSPSLPNADERDRELIYRAYLGRFLDNIDGIHSDSDWLFDSAKLLIAAQTALKHDDRIDRGDKRIRSFDRSGAELLRDYVPPY